ncbi:MAG: DEAD/DEAH box helicase [Gammaproteobacteria bacterium]|nr:DEAD/DEAH box helicase [Gammaproteobacteria bacterium]NNF60376.1 DEAD/DEAH box helicase [Gammaproteobacteria bacterium]
MSLEAFHPAVSQWFSETLGRPTEVQQRAWPSIGLRRHTLLAAPTGSGKTLAAFLSAIDDLVREGLERGLPDETRVLYISPLKALSNDIQKNLQQPLEGIRERLFLKYAPGDVEIRAWVRTGDTPAHERQKAARTPPHILVTTPESVYILLTSKSGREMLSTVRTVIVDEIHAIAGNKRGAHLSLSLERLEALVPHRLARVGLSATQKPIEGMARFLVGNRDESVEIIDTTQVFAGEAGAPAQRPDIALEIPRSPLATIMSNEEWIETYDRLTELIEAHKTTLIFVNTRRLAERAARHLAERIGEEFVTAHHGSLSRKHRLRAEQKLKNGQLKALVATASLELGIDIGDVDLVCQLGSPRSISAFVQRVGRSGHAVGATPKGRLFPLSQDDLVECTAITGCVERGELDRIAIRDKPLDVLAQQIVAEVAGKEWETEALWKALRCAWPYRTLRREEFDNVINMLAQGFSTRRGRRGAHIHHDAVNGRVRPRRGARIVSMTNGGAIPDQFEYEVILQPEDARIGTLGEDFAFESLPGDIFQLGNMSYQIQKVETGRVFVTDANGQPPNLPFWVGEAPGRSDELSLAVSDLRGEVDEQLDNGHQHTVGWLTENFGLQPEAGTQLVDYLASAKAALGLVPTQQHIVFERFFDDAGDMHFIIHAPFGSRANRAWGLALRKRFCRKFNFELQAAAMEDSLVLSLGPTHSFPMEEVAGYLKSQTARKVLTQALLDAPMFGARWRWNATIALAVRRNRNGKRVPPQWQRSDAEDLVALVFPDQLACLENIPGEREIPDHPLVNQTIADCMTETMDIEALEQILQRLEDDAISVKCCDLTGPSPLSQGVINARPYAFLDDVPAEERRTLAISSQRFSEPDEAAKLGRLDADAIKEVCEQAWPEPRTADELHDALYVLGFIAQAETEPASDNLEFGWQHLFEQLVGEKRACVMSTGGGDIWACTERLAEMRAILPDAVCTPELPLATVEVDPDTALVDVIRSRLEGLGPVTADSLARPPGIDVARIDQALLALENEGFAVRGRFTGTSGDALEWCDRRLLARIHRYTIKKARKAVQPVSKAAHARFTVTWQGVGRDREGLAALQAVLEQLEGFAAPARAWEKEILPARIAGYRPEMLDQLCSAGRFTWLRLGAKAKPGKRIRPVRTTPITLIERSNLSHWRLFGAPPAADVIELTDNARSVHGMLADRGASFFSDLVLDLDLKQRDVRDAMAELVAWGLVTSDSFAGIRSLAMRRPRLADGRRHLSLEDAGRWSLLRPPADDDEARQAAIEHIGRKLLDRHGVLFRKTLDGERFLPPWRDLLRIYWRLEARGEIRGGRFVTGYSGEQFALPAAIPLLRQQTRDATSDTA